MHNREPLATAADKRQKNGQTALLIAALGGIVAIVSLFLTKHIGWWGVLGGFGIVVVAIILAAIMVDPYEKRFYKAYYNEYLYPELSSVTDDAKIELPNGYLAVSSCVPSAASLCAAPICSTRRAVP